MKTFALALLLALAASPVQEMPQSQKVDQHAWLQQLVGEWTATAEATMAPGAEPMKMESTESVRSIGGLWIVAEGKGDLAGTPVTTLLTLGYDPDKKTFVGTWIDSMQTHLWTYTGTLDDAKKVLTLEAEGPSFDDPTKTAKYRDVITLESPDVKKLASSMLGADGKWTTFLKAEYRRKKK
jgi:hypothetical protein